MKSAHDPAGSRCVLPCENLLSIAVTHILTMDLNRFSRNAIAEVCDQLFVIAKNSCLVLALSRKQPSIQLVIISEPTL